MNPTISRSHQISKDNRISQITLKSPSTNLSAQVSFVIKLTGRYFMNVKLNNKDISGSPFTINVYGDTNFLFTTEGIVIVSLSSGIAVGKLPNSTFLFVHFSL